MGTASLVFGIILIIIGAGIGVSWLNSAPSIIAESGLVATILAGLVLLVPMFTIGGLLLRKFDKDRKKDRKTQL